MQNNRGIKLLHPENRIFVTNRDDIPLANLAEIQTNLKRQLDKEIYPRSLRLFIDMVIFTLGWGLFVGSILVMLNSLEDIIFGLIDKDLGQIMLGSLLVCLTGVAFFCAFILFYYFYMMVRFLYGYNITDKVYKALILSGKITSGSVTAVEGNSRIVYQFSKRRVGMVEEEYVPTSETALKEGDKVLVLYSPFVSILL